MAVQILSCIFRHAAFAASAKELFWSSTGKEMTAAESFAKGLNLFHADAFKDALDALTMAIQLDPEFAEAYAYRGFAYYQQGNHDAAMEDYDKAVAQPCERVLFSGYPSRATERPRESYKRLHERDRTKTHVDRSILLPGAEFRRGR
jgi:tetratricopeptide (TPR) repeat protein